MSFVPSVIEVTVERAGVFVKTTSILMCENLEQAVVAEKNQLQMADVLMEQQGQPFVTVSTELGIRLEKIPDGY